MSKDKSYQGMHFDYCVVGAGPSGLTVSYKLLQAGKKVLLLERAQRVGGLAKSHHYDGHIFDTGPKRFHTDDQRVLDFIQEITQGHIERIGRSTMVYFLGKYFQWPLCSKDLIKMPLDVSLRCMLELLQQRPVKDPASFHQYINSKYGETLYRTFFKPYTQKFLRWDAEDIHADWASTGINRTVIDKRVKAGSLADLFRSVLLPSKIETEFLYPAQGGFGGFYDQLLGLCRQYPGFTLSLSDNLVQLNDDGKRFQLSSRAMGGFCCDDVIWSGNLNALGDLIEHDQLRMPYLNTIFYNIICRKEGTMGNKAQWIYVSKGDSLISRITCMKEFSPYTCPQGYYNLVCELTDAQADAVYFKKPHAHTDGVLEELRDMKFIRDLKAIEQVHVVPVEDTYPIYHRRYSRDFGLVAAKVKKFSRRIHLLGRCGAFWYNNSDHSIRFAIELADKLLKGDEAAFDFRAYFGGRPGNH